MATCSPSDLIMEGREFAGFGSRTLELIQTALLCNIWKASDPVAQCDVSDLMQAAKCFACLTPQQLKVLQTQLLCEILQAGGGGGASCILCGDADPVNAPACTCALFYNRTAGSYWSWDDNLGQWVVFIV